MTARLRAVFGSDAATGRFARYLLVGGLAAIIDLGGFAILVNLGFGIAPSAAISFAGAAICNFILSSILVFRSDVSWHRAWLFMAFAVIGLSINTGVTIYVATWLPNLLAKVAGIGVAFLLNFWMNYVIVFRQSSRQL